MPVYLKLGRRDKRMLRLHLYLHIEGALIFAYIMFVLRGSPLAGGTLSLTMVWQHFLKATAGNMGFQPTHCKPMWNLTCI